MKTEFVRPAVRNGAPLKVRMPDNLAMHLPEEGKAVPLNDYWLNRIRDGDVVIEKAPASKSASAAAAAKSTAKKEA